MKKKIIATLSMCLLVISSVMTIQAATLGLNPFVNADELANAADVLELRKQLVGASTSQAVDVNEDYSTDVCDLVALLNYLDSFGDNDVQDTWN